MLSFIKLDIIVVPFAETFKSNIIIKKILLKVI